MPIVTPLDSQSVSDFTVPPRAHPSTGSQSGSASAPDPGRRGLPPKKLLSAAV